MSRQLKRYFYGSVVPCSEWIFPILNFLQSTKLYNIPLYLVLEYIFLDSQNIFLSLTTRKMLLEQVVPAFKCFFANLALSQTWGPSHFAQFRLAQPGLGHACTYVANEFLRLLNCFIGPRRLCLWLLPFWLIIRLPLVFRNSIMELFWGLIQSPESIAY